MWYNLSHGIGIYQGMELIEKQGQKFEHLTIEFEGGTKLYVPSSKIDLVQRYVGATKARPKLARIGRSSLGSTEDCGRESGHGTWPRTY